MGEAVGIVARLSEPHRLWSRSECLTKPSPVPKVAGLYGWYFREVPLPADVDTTTCVRSSGGVLLYVGIAPTRPLGLNGRPSTSSLRSRIRQHYAGNAEGSTLRLTLGTLLAPQLRLTRASMTSKSFGEDENAINAWMSANAYVTWAEHPAPWSVERQVINALNLPLNLADNLDHPFRTRLRQARSALRVAPRDRALGEQ